MVAKPKKTKGKMPITRHPLFAPMIALWFATLFGLGSLAIRPTLLESFVLALRLDLIVPAAAPPLGFTFRILLALCLFVIGGAIGFVLARRFSRPAQASVAPTGRSFMRKGQAAPAAAAPVVAVDQEDDDDDFARLDTARQVQQEEEANANSNRRRSLALDEDFQNDYRDFVPLPGGEPQILDLAELGPISEVEELEEEPQQQFAPQAEAVMPEAEPAAEEGEAGFDPWRRHTAKVVFQPQAESAEPQADFAQPPAAQDFSQRPAGAQDFRQFNPQADFSQPAGQPDFAQPAPFAAPGQPSFAPPAATTFAAPQEFQPVERTAAPSFAPPAAPEVSQVFEAAPVFEAQPARADFTPPAHEPLFPRAPEAEVQSKAPAVPVAFDETAPAFASPVVEPVAQAAVPVEYVPEAAPAAVEAPVEQPAAVLPVFGQASGDAAERLVASPVGSLGVVQLAERLALAISRKRGSATAAIAAEAVSEYAMPAPLSPPVPVPSPLPPSFTPPSTFAAPEPAPFAAPFAAPQEAVAEVAELAVEAEPEVPETVSAATFAAPPPAMPAALRPLAFDDGADDEPLESFAIPPRGFAVPPAPVFTAPAPEPAPEPEVLAPAASAAPVPRAFEPEAAAQAPAFTAPVAAEPEAEEEGFASLLDMKPQGRPFVRIEEPEAQGAAIEPVVIFPGQDTRPAFHQSQAFGAANGADPAAGRPFDGPALGAVAPVRMPTAPAPAIDAEETERQLKAALATLQRMSGAA